MVGIVYERGVAAHQEIQFGTDVSNAVSQLTFNAQSLFHGVIVPVGLVGQLVTIPLAPLQALVASLIPC